jgi:hypothetical protein
LAEWFRYETDKRISSALGIKTHPGRLPVGSLASLDSGTKGDLRYVRIGFDVGVRARDSFQKEIYEAQIKTSF